MLMDLSSSFCLLFYFIAFLSFCDLSPINNDNNNQRQIHATNTIVNQPKPAILSTRLTTSPTASNIQWINKLKNVTENRGSAIILECQVESFYPVSFNWYRYNNPLDKNRFSIDQNAYRSSIYINSLKDSEAGFYTCEVSDGFQTVVSTGFVRVKNPVNIDSIDFNDEILPSSEFQPEIVMNHYEKANQVVCEQYSGKICQGIIGSEYVSTSNRDQKEIEDTFNENLHIIAANFLPEECHRLLLPMICLFTFPMCDNNRTHVRSICRQSCYRFQNKVCPMLFHIKSLDALGKFQALQNMPTCESLPPSSDDSSCIDINQTGHSLSKSSTTSSESSLVSTKISSFYIIPITVGVIILLMLFLCRCFCRQLNKNSHLSTCSSTSTPIKKSSHLVNTVTSSPFRSSITGNKQNPRLIPSSSSSTNTNFTNPYFRQTLLKSELRPPNLRFPMADKAFSEVSFINVRFLQELGEGDFGRIYKGELIDSSKKCIIKTLQTEYATPQNREEYAREIEIFRNIHHVNVSCLLGICVQPQNALSLMIYERLNDGDLHEYLLQRSTTLSSHQQRDLTDFLYISMQIVAGMIYLTENNLVHNDLSAKNILISEHMDIKISNIARYRPKYDTDYYKIANRALPVRWMAIESLLSGIYSEMSDVWSFGVLLWEMFSYGTQPYSGRTNPEVIEMIRDRTLLACPPNCPKRVYALMYSCWEEISEQRPTFNELMKRLRQLEEKSATLSSTASSSLIDVQTVNNPGDLPTPKYRTFISPPPPPPVLSLMRNDTPLTTGRTVPHSLFADKDSIRFEV